MHYPSESHPHSRRHDSAHARLSASCPCSPPLPLLGACGDSPTAPRALEQLAGRPGLGRHRAARGPAAPRDWTPLIEPAAPAAATLDELGRLRHDADEARAHGDLAGTLRLRRAANAPGRRHALARPVARLPVSAPPARSTPGPPACDETLARATRARPRRRRWRRCARSAPRPRPRSPAGDTTSAVLPSRRRGADPRLAPSGRRAARARPRRGPAPRAPARDLPPCAPAPPAAARARSSWVATPSRAAARPLRAAARRRARCATPPHPRPRAGPGLRLAELPLHHQTSALTAPPRPRRAGGTGRRKRLKIARRKAWGFESPARYSSSASRRRPGSVPGGRRFCATAPARRARGGARR